MAAAVELRFLFRCAPAQPSRLLANGCGSRKPPIAGPDRSGVPQSRPFSRTLPRPFARATRNCCEPRLYECIGQNNRPMFECDGPERCESAIISFSFELGNTRRPDGLFEHDRRPSGSGLASGHSECDKRVTGDSRDRVHSVPPKPAEIGRIRLAFLPPTRPSTWSISRR